MRIRSLRAGALLALLLLPFLGPVGCAPSPSPAYPRHYDFQAHLAEAHLQTPDPTYIRAGEPIPVAGERRLCLFEHPDSEAVFPAVPVHRDARLEFGVGIHQEAWSQPGDGARFVVEVVDEAGRRHLVYDRRLDPYHRPEDRAWFDETVDLGAYAGQRLQFVFRTESGQSAQNDWAAWSQPVLTSWEERADGPPPRPNVLLITLDTVRADHLSAYGYSRQTSPALDRLAREGILFTRAYSHNDHTNPSHLTMLTGLYPRSHGILDNDTVLPPEMLTIPERLQEAGYHTVGVVSAYHLGREWNMDQGFADYYPPSEARRPAGKTTDLALEWLIERPAEPFFMWVHYFDPHAPYRPPAPYDALYDPAQGSYHLPTAEVALPADWPERYGDWPPPAADVAEVIASYDGAIAYTDAQVAHLLAYLEESGLADRTIVIVTADHGEGFGEHGVAYDHYGLYEEMVHVPLIVWAPGRLPRGRVVDDPVGHVDLGPTLFEMLGLPLPEEMPGLSLLPLMQGRSWGGHPALIAQQHDDLALAARTNGWLLILQQQDEAYWPRYSLRAGQVELYDRGADPEERNNLWPSGPAAAQEAQRSLSQRLLDWEKATPYPTWGEAPALDEKTEEMLRRLGY